MNTRSKQAGVSLIELMIVVGIVAILAAWAGPQWSDAVSKDAIASSTNTFLKALRDARDAALDSQTGVNLVATGPVPGNEWGGGWRLLDPVQAAPFDVIENYDGLPTRVTLSANDGTTTISFNAEGIRNAVGDTIFTVCDRTTAGEFGREITVSALGRARITNRVFPCP